MATGIYRLNFNNKEFYVGQSVNIESRFEQHLLSLINNKHTPKLQQAFKRHGHPSLDVLKECDEWLLDIMEAVYINKYPNLLNTVIPKAPNSTVARYLSMLKKPSLELIITDTYRLKLENTALNNGALPADYQDLLNYVKQPWYKRIIPYKSKERI